MVYISNLLEPEEDIPSSRNGVKFPTVSFYDSSLQYVIDDLFNMLYFSSSKTYQEFNIFKFKQTATTIMLKRNIKYDSEIEKFPMPGKINYRVAYPVYLNSTGLNMRDLGKPKGKLEQLHDTLKKYK